MTKFQSVGVCQSIKKENSFVYSVLDEPAAQKRRGGVEARELKSTRIMIIHNTGFLLLYTDVRLQ